MDNFSDIQVSKFQKVRKDKEIIVNALSLKNAKNQLDKLRPVRKILIKKLQQVDGFRGIVLGTKLHIIVWNEKVKNNILDILEKKYKDIIEFSFLEHEKKKARKAYGK